MKRMIFFSTYRVVRRAAVPGYYDTAVHVSLLPSSKSSLRHVSVMRNLDPDQRPRPSNTS
jgi:hypothetical protein